MKTPKQQRTGLTNENVEKALAHTDSVAQAAALLGVHRVSLYRYMRQNGIRIEHERRFISAA